MKLYFLNTCYACPEQYDVYRENGEICSYVRLRWGILYAEYPNVGGKEIYNHRFEDNFKGMLEDEERDFYISQIAEKISEEICGKHIETEYEIITDEEELRRKLNNES